MDDIIDLRPIGERLAAVEKTTDWLEARIWRDTGNHHERIHVLEDHNGDRVHEIELLKSDLERIERLLGINGYGETNIQNDVRDLISTIKNIKGGLISVTDFLALQADLKITNLAITSLKAWQDSFNSKLWQIWIAMILMFLGGLWALIAK